MKPELDIRPFGAWCSPITAETLVSGAIGISEICVDGADIWWAESRPDEDGRIAVMRACEGEIKEITPADAYVRSLVHEYGGGAWWVHAGTLFYVDASDQRLRKITPGFEPVSLTPESTTERGRRYSDGRATPDGQWYICVQECHQAEGEPVNELVAISTDGSLCVEVIWSGADFVSSPRISPDGSLIAWLSWDHPDMPWDASVLHVHDLDGASLGDEVVMLGNGSESWLEPGWGPDGRLFACSDRDEWWNLYEIELTSAMPIPIISGAFEIATPPWVFGMQRWAPTDVGMVAIAGIATGDELILDGATVAVSDTSISSIQSAPGGVVYAGSGYAHENEVVRLYLTQRGAERQVLRSGRDLPVDPGFLITPEAISYPTGQDGTEIAHGLYYPPTNPHHVAPDGELPPLLVLAHGGPTHQARRQLQLGILYWTSRGIAVVDVDYRGSTGYGRSYRCALNTRWGIADVEDCVAAARYLTHRGDVDGNRLMIRGGSAGGFTVLSALANHDVFAAGASRYGVADLKALATDTHKFESRYLDTLIGPWPQAKTIYDERSPVNHVDRFDAPMIVLQGDEDAIVPQSQSEMIVKALKDKGIPVCYLLFEGEQHGFRKSENVIRALEAELAFFGEMLNFVPADILPPIEISR